MFTYVVQRVLLMFPTLLGITVLVFFVMAFSPGGIGGPLMQGAGGAMSSVDAARVREYYNKRYGIDKPKIVQYGRWLNLISPVGFQVKDDGTLGQFGFKAPSFGESLAQHRPVSDLIAESLPITLLLNLISIPLIYGIGIVSGILAARRRGGLYDTVSGVVQLGTWSVPTIWAGVMLIGLLANREYLKWFPTSGLHDPDALTMAFLPHHTLHGWERGWLLDAGWHLVLPVVCLSYGGSAFLTKLTRGSMLENLAADYVRTARAKGVEERVVLYHHVFRNSLLALITVAANILPAMIGGSVIVEKIFSIPGMGRLAVESVYFRDREVVLAVTLIGGLVGLLSQILRDILYALADPRVRYD
jgi:ABC-type dipeptide/oligopeptide/nickel transport system permease component